MTACGTDVFATVGFIRLAVRSITSALDAAHDRLTSDVLVAGDPDYPFPDEDYLEFVLVRLEHSWDRERERATWTVPDRDFFEVPGVEVSEPAQAGLGDFA